MRKVLCVVFSLLCLCSLLFASGVDSYCYDNLTMGEQMAYEAISDCLTHLIRSWNSGSFSQATIQKAYNCFLMDHPEVYWSDGYTYVTSYVNNTVSGHHVEFDFNMDLPQIQERNAQLENALIEIALTLPSLEPGYETVKAVYDWMVTNCTYDELNLDQSMYSVMVNHSGVCASFSKAFQFILQCLGIPCTVVNGRIDQRYNILGSTLGHEWNIVNIDGSWYHVDVTSGLSMTAGSNEIDYTFLCATTEEILGSHTIANIVPIPQCDNTDLNFFNHYNLKVATYTRDEVARAFSNAIAIGRKPVVRFSSYRAFSAAIEDLFTNQGIFELLKSVTGQDLQSLNYVVDEQTLTIRIDL
ncbi:MAG: hypothetical protein MJ057_04255 [Sphaerochaetaceae bacterium]|nr:hypothetical protein [Sphaerochaetaceae bacterium]